MVFTAFFCGTGSNHFDTHHRNYKSGELISTLAKNHPGLHYVDYLILDGPGSGNLQENVKFITPKNYPKIVGSLTGKGWENNVNQAIAVLKCEVEKKRIDNDPFLETILETIKERRQGNITKVNLIGWSRGAVTCYMMANAMFKDPKLKNIPVNIFAVDPVPGLLNASIERIILNNNVINHIGVYALDERSLFFNPILPLIKKSENHGTNGTIITFPGRHATLVGNSHTSGASKGPDVLEAPGKIVRHLAEEFLKEHGTLLNNTLNYHPIDLLRLYDEMIKYTPEYNKMNSFSYTKLKYKVRSFFSANDIRSSKLKKGKIDHLKMGEYNEMRIYGNSGPTVFINNHHMKIFFKYFGGNKNITDYIELSNNSGLKFTTAYLSLYKTTVSTDL